MYKKSYQWQKVNTANFTECTITTLKYGGSGIMLWGCFQEEKGS